MANLESIQSRITRAKRGIPTGGKLPYARTFDKATGKWGIDTEKHQIVIDAAKRYLKGTPVPVLADEYRMNAASLYKTLTRRCGEDWVLHFDSDDFNIHEKVSIKVPPLLPEETIQAILRRAETNRTFTHGQSKNKYLLARMIFCEHCGYAMFGQTKRTTKKRHYRHAHNKRVRECPCQKKRMVDANIVEENVIRHLFEQLGNPAGVERAISRAVPNKDRIEELQKRGGNLVKSLEKVKTGRQTHGRVHLMAHEVQWPEVEILDSWDDHHGGVAENRRLGSTQRVITQSNSR